MPADAGYANALECGLDLLFQHGRQVEWLAPLELFRSKDEVFRSAVKTLRSPLQKAIFQPRVHRKRLSRSLRLCVDQMPSATPIIGMLNIEGLVVEIAIHPAECAQFASTGSQPCVQKHEKLIPEFELGQNQGHLVCRQLQWRLLALGTYTHARAWASLSTRSNRYA